MGIFYLQRSIYVPGLRTRVIEISQWRSSKGQLVSFGRLFRRVHQCRSGCTLHLRKLSQNNPLKRRYELRWKFGIDVAHQISLSVSHYFRLWPWISLSENTCLHEFQSQAWELSPVSRHLWQWWQYSCHREWGLHKICCQSPEIIRKIAFDRGKTNSLSDNACDLTP